MHHSHSYFINSVSSSWQAKEKWSSFHLPHFHFSNFNVTRISHCKTYIKQVTYITMQLSFIVIERLFSRSCLNSINSFSYNYVLIVVYRWDRVYFTYIRCSRLSFHNKYYEMGVFYKMRDDAKVADFSFFLKLLTLLCSIIIGFVFSLTVPFILRNYSWIINSLTFIGRNRVKIIELISRNVICIKLQFYYTVEPDWAPTFIHSRWLKREVHRIQEVMSL